jgi:hypothetical protein
MRLILPRPSRQIFCGFAALVMAACHHVKDPVVPPGPPLPAEPDLVVGTADQECEALLAALAVFDQCPNADEEDHAWARAWTKATTDAFTVGKKGVDLDANALHTQALACRRAAISVDFATQRCHAGKRPRLD